MTVDSLPDEYYMQMAIELAREAMDQGEVPVGAVVVRQGEVIARARNEKEATGDPTDHAEMLAIRRAVQRTGSWRLTDAAMFVTLEPCPMCAGAMVQARLGRLVFGTYDSKGGAVGSLIDILDLPGSIHRVAVKSGILKEECGELLSSFFEKRR
ncbi:MAG: tRNA adenosine(34) deaminase TadA [Chitinophagales bacterium]